MDRWIWTNLVPNEIEFNWIENEWSSRMPWRKQNSTFLMSCKHSDFFNDLIVNNCRLYSITMTETGQLIVFFLQMAPPPQESNSNKYVPQNSKSFSAINVTLHIHHVTCLFPFPDDTLDIWVVFYLHIHSY